MPVFPIIRDVTRHLITLSSSCAWGSTAISAAAAISASQSLSPSQHQGLVSQSSLPLVMLLSITISKLKSNNCNPVITTAPEAARQNKMEKKSPSTPSPAPAITSFLSFPKARIDIAHCKVRKVNYLRLV